jgi:hypothetical protein
VVEIPEAPTLGSLNHSAFSTQREPPHPPLRVRHSDPIGVDLQQPLLQYGPYEKRRAPPPVTTERAP